ncbi:hypothetical protein Micbo1qcDRAFT_175497 [Microdochium bolleyi]|uniref:Uncharacterized protein n=1 Tax=Microdochium bolleyi TaxID=196109 RepID=A0A136J218_9PEZI|nr:hypothetical protein Micbo1qcDRAFT_175497 [Microdochium bolleyi]
MAVAGAGTTRPVPIQAAILAAESRCRKTRCLAELQRVSKRVLLQVIDHFGPASSSAHVVRLSSVSAQASGNLRVCGGDHNFVRLHKIFARLGPGCCQEDRRQTSAARGATEPASLSDARPSLARGGDIYDEPFVARIQAYPLMCIGLPPIKGSTPTCGGGEVLRTEYAVPTRLRHFPFYESGLECFEDIFVIFFFPRALLLLPKRCQNDWDAQISSLLVRAPDDRTPHPPGLALGFRFTASTQQRSRTIK